jgi:TRAP-type C4-dicarboxylate transport system permease small subunit
MGKGIRRIADFLSRVEMFTGSIHRAIAGGCGAIIFLLMILVVSDVMGRNLFLSPVPGTLEISTSLLVFVAFLSLAHVLAHGEHVKITIFTDRLSPRVRDWFNLFALAVGFSLMSLTAWQALLYALHSYQTQEVASQSFRLPLYFAKFAFFAGCTMFCIQFLIQLVVHLFGQMFHGMISGRKDND